MWVALGPNPLPSWDDAHFLAGAWRLFNAAQTSGLVSALIELRTVKPWLLEIIYVPIISAGAADPRWFLLPSMIVSWAMFVVVYATGRRMAPPVLALLSAIASVAAFRMAAFSLATQTEIFLCLGVAIGALAAVISVRPIWIALLLAASWTLLMSGKQSSIVYVIGLGAIFASLSPRPRRERLIALGGGALLTSLYVVPVYWLNFVEFAAYARQVAGLQGDSFRVFLTGFVRGSIGYPVTAALLLGTVAAATTTSRDSRWRSAIVCGVITIWTLVFGAVLSHNVFRYILPAIPLIALVPCFVAGRTEPEPSLLWRAITSTAIALCIASLLLTQMSTHAAWHVPGFTGGRPALGRGAFCQLSLTDWLAQAVTAAPDRNPIVWTAGDHQFLNYETLRWRLEQLGAREYGVALLADPVGDYDRRRAAGERVDLLLVVNLGGVNLTPADARHALVSLVERDAAWRSLNACEGVGGDVRAFVTW